MSAGASRVVLERRLWQIDGKSMKSRTSTGGKSVAVAHAGSFFPSCRRKSARARRAYFSSPPAAALFYANSLPCSCRRFLARRVRAKVINVGVDKCEDVVLAPRHGVLSLSLSHRYACTRLQAGRRCSSSPEGATLSPHLSLLSSRSLVLRVALCRLLFASTPSPLRLHLRLCEGRALCLT